MEQPWDLFRRGQLDQERHLRLIREAVRKNLADLVTHGSITAGGRVRVPVKALKQWRFEFDPYRHEHTGTFAPDPFDQATQGQGQPKGRPRKGDVVGYLPRQGKGSGSGGPGGEDGGEGTYEVEVGVEAVAEALFADLELPRLQRKLQAQQVTEEWHMEALRRRGAMSNLDKRRTALENVRRNAAAGRPGFGGLSEDDLRFRAADLRFIPQDQVAVIFVRDCSGSMGEQEKHLTRVLAFWISRFLQFKYRKAAETAFVLFNTSAMEVSEEDFFHRSEGGGTVVSTGFGQAREIIRQRFSPESYNLYVFAFSDGDNPVSDTPQVMAHIRELEPICNLIGYADITPNGSSDWSEVGRSLRDASIPHLVSVRLKEQKDALTAMQRFFRKS